ncbi:PH domain-containing protein, partial [Staphylococcus equorum]
MTNDQLFNRSPKQAMKYYYIIEGLEFIVSLIVSVILIFLWSHFNWWHFIVYLIAVHYTHLRAYETLPV